MDTAAARERAQGDYAAIYEQDGIPALAWRVRLNDRCKDVVALADEVDRLQAIEEAAKAAANALVDADYGDGIREYNLRLLRDALAAPASRSVTPGEATE